MLGVNRLRMLCEVHERGSIAAAAHALGYTPPAVSQQLAVLEREARVALLERGPRHVSLTEAGRRLVLRAEAILGDLAAAEAELRRLAGLEDGTVRIAAFPSAAAAVMPELIEALCREWPGLQTELEDLEPVPALAALRQGKVDVAIVYEFADQPLAATSDIAYERLREDPFLVCVQPGSALAALDEVDLATLAQQRWVADGEPPAEACFALRFLSSRGFTPVVAARSNDPLVVRNLIMAGCGVALLPQLQVQALTGVAAVRLSEPPRPRRLLLATRPGSEVLPPVRAVLPIVRRLIDPRS
jgi:DNA-binding transcriptional LysR family regulator